MRESKIVSLWLVPVMLLMSSPLWAGGFDIADQGARSAGRSGAFTAKADDVSAIEYNPAGLARMRGTQIYLGNRFTYSNEEYRRAPTLDWSEAFHGVPQYITFDPVENSKKWQILGSMLGISSDFGLDDWGFALGVYGPPGTASQKFPEDGGQRYMLIERDVLILYYSASVAWKYNDVFGIGISLQWVDLLQMNFELAIDGNVTPRIVNPVSSRFDMISRISGTDHVGFSGILGMWYRPFDFLDIGLSARLIPVYLKADCTLQVDAIELDLTDPVKMSRNGVETNDVTFSMTLPPKLRLGLRYIYLEGETERFDIELDFGYEAWSLVDKYRMDGNNLLTEVLGQELYIDKIDISKNWKDTYSIRLGADFNAVPEWFTVRVGGFYESPSAPDENSYIDFFGSHRLGVSGGFSVMFFGADISASYTYVFQMPVTVTEEESQVFQQVPGSACVAPYDDEDLCAEQYLGKPAAPSNAGTYLADYHFISASVSYTF